MREGVIQLNTSGTTGYSFGKNILDLNLIYTRNILVDQRSKFKKQNFRSVGKDVENELVLPVEGMVVI